MPELESGCPEIKLEDFGDVRVATIDRPQAANALTIAMRSTLCEVFSAVERDSRVKALLLTGNGATFSAGVDVREAAELAAITQHDRQFMLNPGKALRAMTTPVICAVNGACVSGALEIALSSTLIVASERARFADTHAKIGAVPAWGLTALLPDAVGLARARELSITGTFVDAAEALRIGLVNHVVPHEVLLQESLQIASTIVAGPATGEVLWLYSRGAGLPLDSRLALEADHVARRSFDAENFQHAGEDKRVL